LGQAQPGVGVRPAVGHDEQVVERADLGEGGPRVGGHRLVDLVLRADHDLTLVDQAGAEAEHVDGALGQEVGGADVALRDEAERAVGGDDEVLLVRAGRAVAVEDAAADDVAARAGAVEVAVDGDEGAVVGGDLGRGRLDVAAVGVLRERRLELVRAGEDDVGDVDVRVVEALGGDGHAGGGGCDGGRLRAGRAGRRG